MERLWEPIFTALIICKSTRPGCFLCCVAAAQPAHGDRELVDYFDELLCLVASSCHQAVVHNNADVRNCDTGDDDGKVI